MLTPEIAETLLRRMSDAVTICDADGVIRFWNGGAERIFGFSDADAVGQSLDIIIPERQRARHWAGWRAAMRAGETRYGAGDLLRTPAQTQDGRRISIEFSITLLVRADGTTGAVAAVIRDVTAAYEAQRRLGAD